MAGIRLVISRPVPPPPWGDAYLVDGLGRVLFGGALLTTSFTDFPPTGFAFASDEDDAILTDEAGVELLLEKT